jgi:hypothetical protein
MMVQSKSLYTSDGVDVEKRLDDARVIKYLSAQTR